MTALRDGKIEYEGKNYLLFRDLGGLVAVVEEVNKDIYLVFRDAKGDVEELVKLNKGMESLKGSFLQEIFPDVINTANYHNFLLCLVTRSNRRYLFIYKTMHTGKNLEYNIRAIYQVSHRDTVIFNLLGEYKIIPFGIGKIFSIGDEGFQEVNTILGEGKVD